VEERGKSRYHLLCEITKSNSLFLGKVVAIDFMSSVARKTKSEKENL
jgi:hypothetical protein